MTAITGNKKVSSLDSVEIPSSYKPTEDEEYMCDMHLAYFKQKLSSWKNELQSELGSAVQSLKNKTCNESDINDRATTELDISFEIRQKERALKLIEKINDALERINKKEYGFCAETGVPIGLKRLAARPIATLCIEAQERHEKFEKNHNEHIPD